MSVPYFPITAAFLLWFWLLLCLGLKLALDFRNRTLRAERSAAVKAFFHPGTGDVKSPEFQALRRACRQIEFFHLACDCWTELAPTLDRAEYARLYTCLVRLFHDQLDSGLQTKYPLFRCMLLERMSLCRVRSPRLDEFLALCRKGDRLEQLWCRRCTESPVSTGGIR